MTFDQQLDKHANLTVIVIISLFLAVLRIGGDKSQAFIGFAHGWTLLMLTGWGAVRKPHCGASAAFLSVVEIACFIKDRLS